MKKLVAVCVLLVTSTVNVPRASAFDDVGFFGYGYGLALGPAWVFRNRLPTPPYFSIYSPVYYGQRYERPYGISPFPAMPSVHVPATYQAQLKSTATTIINPNCAAMIETVPHTISTETSPLASTTVTMRDFDASSNKSSSDEPSVGKSTWIENPYVVNSAAIATN